MDTQVPSKQIDQFRWEIPKFKPQMRVPVRVFATSALFNNMGRDRTLLQATNVASLPGIVDKAIVMPDGHEGYGFPIGGVAAFNMEEGIISPGGVGYDINCGVRMLRTDIKVGEIKDKMKELINSLFFNVPSGVGSKGKLKVSAEELREVMTRGCKWAVEKGYGVKEDLERCEEGGALPGANPDNISPNAMRRGSPQLGTLGAGNHFLEIQEIREIHDPEIAKVFELEKGNVSVMIHCGSRGFGHQVCSDYIHVMLEAAKKYGIDLPDRELACAPLGSKEAEKYYSAMVCAVNYAFTNRHVIAHWVRDSFAQVLGKSREELGMKLIYDVCHNVAKFEEHGGKKLCVHRKGATRAFGPGRKEIPEVYQKVGQPVLIAGTMGTSSYILAGTESGMKEVWGSSCHGAGRVMSRSAAIRKYWGGRVKDELEKTGKTVRAKSMKILAEEAPGAYKNVDHVIETMHGAGLTKKVAKVVPLGVVKG
jgi:tRNA-splicing ligase RtcB